MKKKLLALILALIPAVFMFGCNDNGSNNSGNNNSNGNSGEDAAAIYSVYTNIPADNIYDLNSKYTLKSQLQGGATFGAYSAASGLKQHSKTYYYMSTYESLVVYLNESDSQQVAKFDSLADDVDELLKNAENLLSTNISTSDIAKFNSAAAGETVEVNKLTYDVLTTAISVYTLTEGYYNPAVYYSVQAYYFNGSNLVPTLASELPSDEKIEKYRELAGHFGEVTLAYENGKYSITKPAATVDVDGETLSLKIDLGGIGKGYATDMVNELIDSYGFKYGYFNMGSSSMAVKQSVATGYWALKFMDPRGNTFNDDYYIKININDVCISTSGDYEQYYIIDDVRYCHIIDPTTGKPVQTGIMTATIIGGSAAEDDALTTAIMTMGKDKAIEFINTKLSDRYVAFTYNG
jgi:thiamine biosynthesis lipoprotein